ncbi:MAG TPA: hypothetical protein VF331_11450 [Polyangiales bacterium]
MKDLGVAASWTDAAARAGSAVSDARLAAGSGTPVSYTMVQDYVIGELQPLQEGLAAAAEGASDGSAGFVQKQQDAIKSVTNVTKKVEDTNALLARKIGG